MNQQIFNSLLRYENGKLYWRVRRSNNCRDRAGNEIGGGYRQVSIDKVKYREHRIIWIIHYGDIPEGITIDHSDGDPSNNKIENLRLATFVEQGHNVKLHRKSTSGVKGVSWHKSRGKWRAYIRANNVTQHLGLFGTLEEAAKVATDARKELHGEFYRE